MALDTAATAWMLVSASLVLLMTVPALALFYGGMSQSKSVLNMMMMSFGATAVVGVVYVLYGWSMSYGGTDLAGLIANPLSQLGLHGAVTDAAGAFLLNDHGVPVIVDVAFQMTFAVITVALISGAIADRVRFGAWMTFVPLWVTLAYLPLAHMVWGGGILSDQGWFSSLAAPIDFAGGTVVHINAGVAGFFLAVAIGRRRGFGRVPMRPHNLPLTMLGAGLLWIGWFGFNACSALTADGVAGLAWVNTTVAACAAVLGWLAVERVRNGHATSLGAASGVVAGLVGITPAAGAVTPVGAIVLGLVVGALCACAVGLEYRLGYDDSLDVVGVHLVGGLAGTILVGLLAKDTGLLYGHGSAQLLTQVLVAVVAMSVSLVTTAVCWFIVKQLVGWRAGVEAEHLGLDKAEHGESAYDSLTTDRLATPLPPAVSHASSRPPRAVDEVLEILKEA
ncbi:ammonium transporter [Actinomyces urogenitalis DSM 15434]|uniref:Ammonium transporter n=3 Tax=root TaxID=1 RepID=C0W780_9ACTO|nr:ammonium transporter [Actinomyces urogenitalis]EEH65414.1 ammonium transporter [Actinomyces urogenitalis DSM 15434]